MIESIIDSIIHISSTIACGYNGYIIELHRIQYICIMWYGPIRKPTK